MKILYADGDALVRTLVCEIFTKQNHCVDVAIDAGQFVAMAEKGNHDLFIVAYNLPDMPGTDALRSLIKADIKTPAIVFTGNPSTVPIGPWHTVNKVVNGHDLLAAVKISSGEETATPA